MSPWGRFRSYPFLPSTTQGRARVNVPEMVFIKSIGTPVIAGLNPRVFAEAPKEPLSIRSYYAVTICAYARHHPSIDPTAAYPIQSF